MHQQACSGGSCPTPNSGGHYQHGAGQCGPADCSKKQDCCVCPSSMLDEMSCAVKCAKMCLMKEKMKAKLDAKIGKKLDEAADIAVELFLDQWEHKVGYSKKKHELEERMTSLIMG